MFIENEMEEFNCVGSEYEWNGMKILRLGIS